MTARFFERPCNVSSQARAPDDLLEDWLIGRKFVFRRDEYHIKEVLIVETRHDPYDFGRIRRIRFTDHDGAQARLVTDQGLYLRARYDAQRLIALPEEHDQTVRRLFQRECPFGDGNVKEVKQDAASDIRADHAVRGSNDAAIASGADDLPARGVSEAVIILRVHKFARYRVAWRDFRFPVGGRVRHLQ